MWATTSSSDVYHLVIETEEATLCGLKVTPVVINRSTETSILHLTAREPSAPLCEDCARAQERSVKQVET